MVTYVSLITWTEEGIKNVKETVQRAESVSKAAEELGGKLTHILWTQGSYDLVAISEFPDEEAAQVFFLRLGRRGTVRTNTLRAFSADEMTKILERLT